MEKLYSVLKAFINARILRARIIIFNNTFLVESIMNPMSYICIHRYQQTQLFQITLEMCKKWSASNHKFLFVESKEVKSVGCLVPEFFSRPIFRSQMIRTNQCNATRLDFLMDMRSTSPQGKRSAAKTSLYPKKDKVRITTVIEEN